MANTMVSSRTVELLPKTDITVPLNEAVEQNQKHCGADTYVQAVALPGESYDAECNSDYRCRRFPVEIILVCLR